MPTKPKFSSVSLQDVPFSSYSPVLRNVLKKKTKKKWHVQGYKYACVFYTHSMLNFLWAFSSYIALLWEKCAEITWNYLTFSKSKIPMCIRHMTAKTKFSSVSFYNATFICMIQFWEKCTKWPQMTLDMGKVPVCTLHTCTDPRTKFSSVSLCTEPFSSYGHFMCRQ